MRELFIAPNGSDTNPGTQDKPLATLDGARTAVRTLTKAGLPKGGVTVWLRGGSYELAAPFELAAEDSGTVEAPVLYRGWPDEAVCLSGGRQVKAFAPVTDPAILVRLPETARGKVLVADLIAQGITDYGQVTEAGKRLELFFDNTPMTIARWPNTGFMKIVAVNGEEPFTVHGIAGSKVGKFTYDGDRPARWAAEKDIWLFGYWFWDWSDSYGHVASIDTAAKLITLDKPYHWYGYREGQRYYALNLLCELDAPGEWYLDRAVGMLYFWPPAPLEGKPITLSVLPTLVKMENAAYVSLRGLTLEATRGTAVTINGGKHCRVAGCAIRNTGSWAITITGGVAHSVVGCDISATGEGGVSMTGGDRKTLTPAGHSVENCVIHNFGRLVRTYRPAVGVNGMGNRVAHNLLYDGPHNAIQLGGNEHVIEFNEIHHVCYETGDVGAFYMGRDWSARGTVIRHNYFHDIHGPGLHGAMAVYLDDAASGITIFGNLFYKAGRAAFIGGGRDNTVENNLFVDCTPSVHIDARGLGWMKSIVDSGGELPEQLKAVPYATPPWSERYPKLVNILAEDPGAPRGNVIARNISWHGQWLGVEVAAQPLTTFIDNLVDTDPRFVDPAHGNFQLRDDSPAFALGFKRLPLEQIGLYKDELRASWPALP